MRALIVDDSPSAREQARTALEDAMEALGLSFPVIVAQNGLEALKVALGAETMMITAVERGVGLIPSEAPLRG